MFKVNNKEAGTTSTVSLFLILSLTLRILVSLLLTLIVFHILQDVKNAVIRALYWKKRKKSKFNRLQIEVFFLPNISLPPSEQLFPFLFAISPTLKSLYRSIFKMGVWIIRPPSPGPYIRSSAPGPHKNVTSLN